MSAKQSLPTIVKDTETWCHVVRMAPLPLTQATAEVISPNLHDFFGLVSARVQPMMTVQTREGIALYVRQGSHS